MLNKNPMLSMANYTRTIFVASLDWRRRWRHFDSDLFRWYHPLLRNFFPFLYPFSFNLLRLSPMYLPNGTIWHFEFFRESLQGIWTLSKCSSGKHKSRSFFLGGISKWRQMTIVRQQIPVCIMCNDLCTKLKVTFYCENKDFLPLFFT